MDLVSTKLIMYRVKTALRSLRVIYSLPQEKIDAFLESYKLFDKNVVDDKDEKNIVAYYSVINQLCAIGQVEKMYIPAVIDVTKNVYENQILFERKMCQDLDIKPGDKVLDIGCGRGRVAAHIATVAGSDMTGFNIDDTQLESAKVFALQNKLNDRCHFFKANFNNPFPLPDNSFDALYQIQVLTYAEDMEKLFTEMFRVLKPGGKLSFLDWVKLDNYDPNNVHHCNLMRSVKGLIGAIYTPSAEELQSKLEKVGFKVLMSKDASVGGHQAILIEKADKFFVRMKKLINVLVILKLLPRHFMVLFDRLTKDADAFVEGDRLGLFTTSFQIIAQKPYNQK